MTADELEKVLEMLDEINVEIGQHQHRVRELAERRDSLILQACKLGCSERLAASHAGVSHAWVSKLKERE